MSAACGGRAPGWRWTYHSRERGSVTAETAVVLPALVLVLALCATALAAGMAQIRCVDAARAAARELARGEEPAHARRAALLLAPGAEVSLSADGPLVRVVVTDRPRQLPGVGHLLDLPVRAEAVAIRESA